MALKDGGAVVVAAGATDVGRVRKHNEDAHLIDTEKQIFIVADGMGGHAAGEVASATAVKHVHETWTNVSLQRRIEAYTHKGDAKARRELLKAVREGVVNAHLDILHQAEADEEKRGMGTTFTGFIVAGGEAVFAHAGDSRAYLIRDGHAMQLSEDHTVLSRLRAAGMGPKKGAQKRWKGVLTNALGIGDATRVATFLVPLYTGDRILLCSDGVYEYFDAVEIATMVTEQPSPALAVNSIVESAVAAGGHDNATALLVKVVEAGLTTIPAEQRDRDSAAIEKCALFSVLSPQERLRALRITIGREIKPERELPQFALNTRVAYVILDGEVLQPGRRAMRAGDIVYPEALIDGAPDREEFAETRTNARLLTIRRDDFLELCDEETDIGVKLYAVLAKIMASA
jgi:serine/threonine protein phosphatase PrpC